MQKKRRQSVLIERISHTNLQETTDYARPIVFGVQVGLQDSEDGPVLDDGWPTVVRTEVRLCRSVAQSPQSL